jgi:glycine cleavage system H lipoate-binding protein
MERVVVMPGVDGTIVQINGRVYRAPADVSLRQLERWIQEKLKKERKG